MTRLRIRSIQSDNIWSKRAMKWCHFIPNHVSGGLNWNLAGCFGSMHHWAAFTGTNGAPPPTPRSGFHLMPCMAAAENDTVWTRLETHWRLLTNACWNRKEDRHENTHHKHAVCSMNFLLCWRRNPTPVNKNEVIGFLSCSSTTGTFRHPLINNISLAVSWRTAGRYFTLNADA